MATPPEMTEKPKKKRIWKKPRPKSVRNYHSSGPYKKVVKWMFNQVGFPFTLLECGHATKYHTFDIGTRTKVPKLRPCPLCAKNPVTEDKVKRCVEDVPAALLEGKRLRILEYYWSKNEVPPKKVMKSRSRIALYERFEDAPYPRRRPRHLFDR